MIRTERRLRLCVTLLVLNLIFIWGNSMLPGSVSGAISGWVKDILSQIFSGMPSDAEGGHNLLRKIAHGTEFCCLGLCLSWLFGMLRKPWWLAFLCGAAAACLDETIQCFVPDRGPGIRDVCIDSAGVLVGIILLLAGHAIYQKYRKQEESNT